MSDEVNPYQSPETTAVPENPPAAQGTFLTENMLLYLKGASPWLQFIGILGFIGTGLTVLSGFSLLTLIPLMQNNIWSEIPGFESFSGIFRGLFGGGTTIITLGCAVIMFFPSLFTYRFGDKIRSYLLTGTDQDLELAFKNNKSLWKFYGILAIIYLAFIPLMIIGSIIIAVFAVIAR